MSEIISKWKTMIKVFRISKIKHIEEKSRKKKVKKTLWDTVKSSNIIYVLRFHDRTGQR